MFGGFGGCSSGTCGQAAAPIAIAAPQQCCQQQQPQQCCQQVQQCGGENRSCQYQMPPRFNCQSDCQNRYSQQQYDNNNHIYVTQPVINDRNHYVNNLHRTLIRDNNYHHYRTHNLFRDNVINRHYNQVYRTTRNFCDYSCSQATIQGTCTSTPPVNTYHCLPSCQQSCSPCQQQSSCQSCQAAPAPCQQAAPVAIAAPTPAPACSSCNGGGGW